MVQRGIKGTFLIGGRSRSYDPVFDILDVWFDSAQPTPLFCVIEKTDQKTGWPIFILRAQNSTADGSIPPCYNPVELKDVPLIRAF